MKPDQFPLYLTTGESISTPEALARCIATNTARAKGKGNAAKAAAEILERIEKARKG